MCAMKPDTLIPTTSPTYFVTAHHLIRDTAVINHRHYHSHHRQDAVIAVIIIINILSFFASNSQDCRSMKWENLHIA